MSFWLFALFSEKYFDCLQLHGRKVQIFSIFLREMLRFSRAMSINQRLDRHIATLLLYMAIYPNYQLIAIWLFAIYLQIWKNDWLKALMLFVTSYKVDWKYWTDLSEIDVSTFLHIFFEITPNDKSHENFPLFYYLPNWLKYGKVSPALMIWKFCLMSNNQLLAQLGKPYHTLNALVSH